MKNLIKKPIRTGLKDNLNYMTVDYLKNIARVYEVDKAYKMRKQELIDILFDRITDENYIISNLAAYYEHEEYTYSSYGNEALPESIRVLGLAKIGVYFLYDLGDGNIESIVPEEVKKVIDNIEENKLQLVKNRYSEIFNYLRAFKNLYGIFDIDFFISIFNKQNQGHNELSLSEFMYYFDKYNIHNNQIVNYNGTLVCEVLCKSDLDIDKVIKQREGKEYYILSKEELLKYSNDHYIRKTNYYYNLEKYLLKHLKSQKKVKSIIENINLEFLMNIFDINITINRLHMLGIKIQDMRDIERVFKLCVDFGNNTPKWINKGWTQADLMGKESIEAKSLNLAISKKIGRNEPCSCGSGKKYKQCCGK